MPFLKFLWTICLYSGLVFSEFLFKELQKKFFQQKCELGRIGRQNMNQRNVVIKNMQISHCNFRSKESTLHNGYSEPCVLKWGFQYFEEHRFTQGLQCFEI